MSHSDAADLAHATSRRCALRFVDRLPRTISADFMDQDRPERAGTDRAFEILLDYPGHPRGFAFASDKRMRMIRPAHERTSAAVIVEERM